MSTPVQTAIGRIVWHENLSADPTESAKFYNQLLGWETEVWKPGEMDYPMIKAGGTTHGGFGTTQGGAPSHWLGHILVDDVDETARKAEAAGGKIVFGPQDIPEIGRFAAILDPQGAVTSAFAPKGDSPTPEGTFVWDELMTTDVDGAKSFYHEVYGWTSRDTDMGGAGPYTLFLRGGESETAGLMARPEGVDAPAHWYPYLATDDVDATVARARELGASVYMDGMDIPDMGRFAVLGDPAGATFGVFQSTSSSS